MEALEQLAASLQEAKARRKRGEISEREFYASLLRLSARLIPILADELEDQQTLMQERDIKKQIPLVLAFLEDQIARFRAREAQH